jgi:formate dehydrogenase subunit gamma
MHEAKDLSSPQGNRTAGQRIIVFLALTVLLATAAGLSVTAAQKTSPEQAATQWNQTNPRAAFWREVRQGTPGTTTVSGQERGILIQNGGQNWRRIRNGLIAGAAPWILGVVFFAIALFFVVFGRDKLEERPDGTTIPRFSAAERWLHWITALLFIVMAVTGLSMLFGRAVLIPVFGHQGFSGYMGTAMRLHNYAGPVFLAGVLVEIIAWMRFNIPTKMDLVWFKNLGGMAGKGSRPHAGKINGGEKAWFWIMVVAGLGIGVTGLILDFPNFGQTRFIMQAAHVIHASLAVLFVAASLGHIYIGTIGAEGTFQGMWRGNVSTAWARQHADLWYEEKTEASSG